MHEIEIWMGCKWAEVMNQRLPQFLIRILFNDTSRGPSNEVNTMNTKINAAMHFLKLSLSSSSST